MTGWADWVSALTASVGERLESLAAYLPNFAVAALVVLIG